MTIQQDTLAQLNSAIDQLTAFIITNTATQGSPQWTQLQQVIKQRDSLKVVVNSIIATAFEPDTAALTAAVNDVKQKTQQLTNLNKTMNTIGQIVQIAGTIVQAGTAVLGLATQLV
jgi:predicted ATP-dependent serine protease